MPRTTSKQDVANAGRGFLSALMMSIDDHITRRARGFARCVQIGTSVVDEIAHSHNCSDGLIETLL